LRKSFNLCLLQKPGVAVATRASVLRAPARTDASLTAVRLSVEVSYSDIRTPNLKKSSIGVSFKQ
jgi:hypothetical protein